MLTVLPLALMHRQPAGARLLLSVPRLLLAVTGVPLAVTRLLLAVTRVQFAMPHGHLDVNVVLRISRSVCEHGSMVG